jgi:hypothetical protein
MNLAAEKPELLEQMTAILDRIRSAPDQGR